MQPIEQINIAEAFLESLAKTQDLIMNAIYALANGDVDEVSRIVMTHKAESFVMSFKNAKDSLRYEVEASLSVALNECETCATNFKDGDLVGAFMALTEAHQLYGGAGMLMATDERKKLRDRSKLSAGAINANNGRINKYATQKEELYKYWKESIAPKKTATDAAILLERSPVYKNVDPKPKRSSLERYVREWQADLN